MRILIVEDEHRIAHTIKKGLEQENFAVDVTYDGISAYDLISSEDYDILILDLMIPGIDGITLCNKLRNENNHTPILMLTAKGQTEDKVKGLNSGADDYLTKPFSFEELLARIRALSRRPKQSLKQILSFDNLSLNPNTFSVKRGSTNLKLSAKEFSLLEYLLRNSNQIVNKDQIISHVWNYESDILPNTVEVYIKNLRDKVDKPFNKPLIHTIRGFGYKLGHNHV